MAVRDTDIRDWSTTAASNKPTDGTYIGRDLSKQWRNIKSVARVESLDKEFEKTGYVTTTSVHFAAGIGVFTVVGEGDLTGTFSTMRKLRLTEEGGDPIYVGVDSCSYNGGTDTNTLVVLELTAELGSGPYLIDVGTPNPGASCLPMYHESGSLTIADAATSGTVTFSTFATGADLFYFAKATVVSATGVSPSDFVTRIVKSAGSMDIHIKAAPGVGNSTVIAWGVFRGMP